MSLSDAERKLITGSAATSDITRRRQAVVTVLHEQGDGAAEARALLGQSFIEATQPSFHLIPSGNKMASEHEFRTGYAELAAATQNFTRTDAETISALLMAHPQALTALRMIAGLTVGELAVAMKLVDGESKTSGATLRRFERGTAPAGPVRTARKRMVDAVARTVSAVMNREILTVPADVEHSFHSKLDRFDTAAGWATVSDAAVHGVPYSALLYQRYVGGAWRQVQDSYSEVKGDNVLELPLERLLRDEGIPYFRSREGATGAAETARRYGLSPGPDFVIPDEQPAVIVESKVAEDGGTARDKASRIKNLTEAGRRAGLIVCALIDGKGWRERPGALVDVILATDGRTYTLSTMSYLLKIPDIAGLRGTRTYAEEDLEDLGEELDDQPELGFDSIEDSVR
jgi:hypothetical protein